MTFSEPARMTDRRVPRIFVYGLLLLVVTIAAAHGFELAASSPTGASPAKSHRGEHSDGPAKPEVAPVLPSEHRGVFGEAGGDVPDGATVFDDGIPEIANLDPDLLSALRDAATDARLGGVEFVVNSGWRSPEYQEQLLQQAISTYGSEEEAARWVATPDASPHVSGDAVDIGSSEATAWLSAHGAEYGLCRIYDNEPWHYELRPEAVDNGCPSTYADPTYDPRMEHQHE